MKLGETLKSLSVFFMCFLPIITWASEVPDLTITENTNPKIVELYQQLQDAKSKIDKIQSEHLDKLNENYQVMKEKEQSKENRTLTAATTAATGIGGMELAQGLAEQRSDKTAEQDMAAYLATMRCEYGNGKQVKAGPDEIELPGGNNAEMMKLRAEYFALAADLKERKAALGMKPGIESEEILDKSQLDLYNDESIGITDGAYASIYRAQMLGSEKDKAAIDSDKEASKNRVIGGGIAAAAGVVGGIVGDMKINKDAPKENSDKINREYDKQVAEATAEQDNISQQLNQAIAENAAAVQEYNKQVQQHKDQVALIKKSPNTCRDLFTDYVDTVNEIQPIANETDNVPQNTNFPDINEQQKLLDKCQTCDTKGGVFDSVNHNCPCPASKPIEKNGKCVAQPKNIEEKPTVTPVTTPQITTTEDEDVKDLSVAKSIDEKEKTDEEINLNIDFDTDNLMSPEEVEAEDVPIEVLQYDCENKHGGQWKDGKCVDENGTEIKDDKAEYCPATGNGLKSITDKTKVGDFCSSSNIAEGEVVRRGDQTCTCRASACNACCYSQNGQCKKRGANDTNNCPRQAYKNVPNINNSNDALKFCESKATNNCKVSKAIINYNRVKGQILCNPASEDLPCPSQAYPETNENNTKEKCQSFCQTKSKENNCKLKNSVMRFSTKECVCNPDKDDLEITNMYKKTCGKDKEVQGICVDDVFTNKFIGGINVDKNTAKLLAKEWTRLKGYKEIVCSDAEPRKIGNDETIQCVSKDTDKNGNRTYFEFIFDDIKETTRMTADRGFWEAVFNKLYGYPRHGNDTGCPNYEHACYKTTNEANCTKVQESFKRICGGIIDGCSTKWLEQRKLCVVPRGSADSDGALKQKQSPEDFDNAFNIDPFVFCKESQSQLKNTGSLDMLLKQYISDISSYSTSKIECYAKTVSYCGGGCKCTPGSPLDPADDIKTCVVHGDKDYYVQFVFDDILEFSKKREKGALQSMSCVVSGGVFNGQECKFADKKQCDIFIASSKKTCPQCTPPKWNPDTQLCEVPDAAAVTKMEKTEKTVMIVGGVIVSVAITAATAGAGAPVFAIVLGGVEVAGGAMEYFAQKKIDSMAHEFFLESAKCNSASCAKKTIEDNLQQMANIMNDLEPYEINALDAEFTRLLGLLDPDSEFYNNIVTKGATLADNQKGFFDPEGWNQAQVWRAIGIGLQFASLGTGLIKKIVEAPKFAAKFPKTQAFLTKQIKLNKLFKKGAQVTDVSKDVVEVTSAQAKKLDELESEIAKLESKTNRTEAEAEKLKKLHQERNTLLNKVGTKDADEIAKAKNVAYDKKAVQQAQSEYDEIMKQRDYVEDYMAKHNGNPPSGMSKQRIQELNDKVATAEKKLEDLGQDVTPKEPLQIGKTPTAKPADAKPVDNTPKPDNAKPAENPTSPDSKPATPTPKQSVPDAKELQEIEDALGDRYKNIKPELKNNPDRTAVFGKDYLTDTEWETLNKSLAKENLEVVPSGEVMFVRQKRVFPDRISDIRNRAYNEFNSEVNKIKQGISNELHVPKAHLSDEEWKLLEADLNKEGLEITEANSHYFTVRKSTAKPVPKTPAKPATTAPKAPVASPVATDISALKSKASKNFEEHLAKVKASSTDNPYGAVWKAENMTEAEWSQLNKTLNKEGVEIVDVIRQDGTPGKRIQRIGAKFGKSDIDDVTKGTAKTMNVSYKEGKQLVKAGKWADATVLDPTFDIKVTPLELGGKKYYLKAGDTETLIQNEISRTKQAHELLKHNKIVTSVGVVEDDQTVLKAFMDAHPDITLPRTPDTQYFIMEATHANTVEGLSDAKILGYLRNKPITIEEQNTILSEIQNMNNNGLIHNDIWHNFAIYRDSGGKLHMELMDFGDFTVEDKLLRSNDDVLEIKKLFSKWSDRGLVEKPATPKKDIASGFNMGLPSVKPKANTGKTVNKMDDIAKASTSEAKATTVAQSTKSSKYKIKKTIKPFGNYTGGQKEANGVFEIVDNQTGQIMYLKRTSANEVNMTKRATNVNLGTNSTVRVVQPVDMTPTQIDDMAKSLGIAVPDYVKADTWLLTKAVPDGENLMTIVENGGKLRDGTKIANAEIDNIISDMKKLRNAGVNHTDLYTNTIVRRTANGKLEAYIIDFESAGIHDVNFIEKEMDKIKTIGRVSDNVANVRRDVDVIKEKLSDNFSRDINNIKSGKNQNIVYSEYKSKLSDAELDILKQDLKKEDVDVFRDEYGNITLTKTTNNTSKNTNKARNVASVSADEAKAANVATLRKEASKNFDAYLAEAKTSANGKSLHKIPKSRLNDAGWNEVNKSLASENVQLVDTGDGYMQFVRADHVDDGAEIIAKVVPDVFDARKMRVSDGSGKLYVRNSASEMLGYPVNGDDAVNEVNQLYGTIRRGIEYPVNDTKVSRAINAMEKPSNNAILYRAPTNNYNWHVHSYNGPRGSSAEVQYHVSLNVEVDDALIKKLDDIMAKDQGRHIVDFKIPPVGSRWKTMADPISIYMRGTNPEIERAIAAAAKPYVRTSSEIGLLGRKIDDGVAIAYETSAARMDIVEDIINQVARKDAGVAAKLRAKGRYSVGNTEALRLWASDFLGYTIAPVIP